MKHLQQGEGIGVHTPVKKQALHYTDGHPPMLRQNPNVSISGKLSISQVSFGKTTGIQVSAGFGSLSGIRPGRGYPDQ